MLFCFEVSVLFVMSTNVLSTPFTSNFWNIFVDLQLLTDVSYGY